LILQKDDVIWADINILEDKHMWQSAMKRVMKPRFFHKMGVGIGFINRLNKEWPFKNESAVSVGGVNTDRWSNLLQPMIMPFVKRKQKGGNTGFVTEDRGVSFPA
jgi:hypothetical protein